MAEAMELDLTLKKIVDESRNKHRFIKKNQKRSFIIIRHFILPPFEFYVYLINF